MRVRAIWGLLKDTVAHWWNYNGMRLGASVSFYSMLSLSPLVVVVMAVASAIFGRDAAQGELVEQMRGLAGEQAAEVIQTLLAGAYQQKGTGVIATVLGLGLSLFGAMGVFVELRDALNTIWGVKPNPSDGIWAFIRARFLSFSTVLGVAFLLVVSLIVSAVLAAVARVDGMSHFASVASVVHLVVSILLLGVLFALMFKWLPDEQISWGDTWIGGMVTAVLFGLGRYLIALYVSSTGVGTAYGAAASFAVFLVWAYYSALIFFFGAAFTRAYADYFGSRVKAPGERAEAARREAVHV